MLNVPAILDTARSCARHLWYSPKSHHRQCQHVEFLTEVIFQARPLGPVLGCYLRLPSGYSCRPWFSVHRLKSASESPSPSGFRVRMCLTMLGVWSSRSMSITRPFSFCFFSNRWSIWVRGVAWWLTVEEGNYVLYINDYVFGCSKVVVFLKILISSLW